MLIILRLFIGYKGNIFSIEKQIYFWVIDNLKNTLLAYRH